MPELMVSIYINNSATVTLQPVVSMDEAKAIVQREFNALTDETAKFQVEIRAERADVLRFGGRNERGHGWPIYEGKTRKTEPGVLKIRYAHADVERDGTKLIPDLREGNVIFDQTVVRGRAIDAGFEGFIIRREV